MIDETTLNKIENHARAMHPRTDIGDNVRLLVAEIRELQQVPNRDEMFMTKAEWIGLSAESRHKLNQWVNVIKKGADMLSSAGDDIDRLQARFDHIVAWCKTYSLDDLGDAEARTALRITKELMEIIKKQESRWKFRFLNIKVNGENHV
jgi:hypothetical protein